MLHTETQELTERVLRAWDDHFVHRDLPRKLPGLLRRAGFLVEHCGVLPLLNTDYNRECFSYGLTRVISSFSVGKLGLTQKDAAQWSRGLEELGERGEFFFSLNRYLFLARKSC